MAASAVKCLGECRTVRWSYSFRSGRSTSAGTTIHTALFYTENPDEPVDIRLVAELGALARSATLVQGDAPLRPLQTAGITRGLPLNFDRE